MAPQQRCLARPLSTPRPHPLRVLFKFAEQQQGKVKVMYMVSGWLKVGGNSGWAGATQQAAGAHCSDPHSGLPGAHASSCCACDSDHPGHHPIPCMFSPLARAERSHLSCCPPGWGRGCGRCGGRCQRGRGATLPYWWGEAHSRSEAQEGEGAEASLLPPNYKASFPLPPSPFPPCSLPP